MKVGRQERVEKVEKIKAYLEDADSLILSDYRGLTVGQITAIRREMAKQEASLHVHKNRFVKIALKDKNYPPELIEKLSGPNAMIYVKGDVSQALKVLFDFAKKEYPIEVRGSFSDNTFMDSKESEKLSKLPSRELMLSMLLGTMQAPVQQFARGLKEIITSFARVVQEYAEKKKE